MKRTVTHVSLRSTPLEMAGSTEDDADRSKREHTGGMNMGVARSLWEKPEAPKVCRIELGKRGTFMAANKRMLKAHGRSMCEQALTHFRLN